MIRLEALAAARAAHKAFNDVAPAICRVEWDAAWEAFTADELYDLRDELVAMLDSLAA